MKKKKAAIYTRVSTHHQIDKDSLSFQKQELENYSKYVLGIDDYEVFSDAGYSGKNTKRPGYQRMIEKIENREFTHLLVWKIDRISRNLIDFAKMYDQLKDYNVTFVSKNEQFDTSSAMGEAMLKIILVFAELERNLASERVTSIMIDRAQKGLWNGAPTPLGYDYDPDTQKLTVNEEEAKSVKYIFNTYIQKKSLIKTMEKLEKEKIKTKNNSTKWYTKTLGQILRNPIYKGTYRYNYRESARGEKKDSEEWVEVENAFPSIVDDNMWAKVNKTLDKNLSGFHRKKKYDHVFSSLIGCGSCEDRFVASPGRPRADGYRPSRYRCRANLSSTDKCANFISEVNLGPFILYYIANLVEANKIAMKRNISKKELEETLLQGKYFKEVVGLDKQTLSGTHKLIGKGKNLIFDKKETETSKKIKFKELKKEKKKYERALTRLDDLYLFSESGMSKKDYLVKKKELQDNVEEINEKIFKANAENNNPITDMSFIKKATKFLIARNLLNEDIDYKKLCKSHKTLLKDFIQNIIRNIIVDDKKVIEIEFINGLKHRFVWEENAKGLKGRM
ncbi:recombinase family protein [Orenia marismortui]|uniref:DNA invertase Pin-like site-specific DNA recombinase n=1 Tax=Orenia marismortui TaxID=46469 RepID=A0A4R8GT20_9FIRM|nr:recombinase family protein [Orenia marismortui]TDX49148.1 DNA invertase Pin-like site-specific DNA recombinase [Orenia marismortui]